MGNAPMQHCVQSRTADQPFAAAMRNIRQRRIHNLNEYVIVYVIVGSKKIPLHKDFSNHTTKSHGG